MSSYQIIVNEAIVVSDNKTNVSANIIPITYTTLTQTKKAELVDGSIDQFSIENLITNKGQLPYTQVFVKQVVTRDDPKDDTFLRVAQVSDLTTLPRGRAAALLASSAETLTYLDDIATLAYDTLDTAVTAQTTIRDRVNLLVSDWITYNTQFQAYPTAETILLPIAVESAVDELIAAYTAAKQDRVNKFKLYTDLQELLEQLQEKLTAVSDRLSALQPLVNSATVSADSLVNAQTALDVLITAITTLGTAGGTYLTAKYSADAADAVFTAALNAAIVSRDNAINSSNLLDSAVANNYNYSSNISSFYDAQYAEKQSVQAELNNTATLLVTASRNYDDALVLEAMALAALKAVCPDFDETTVVVAPGN